MHGLHMGVEADITARKLAEEQMKTALRETQALMSTIRTPRLFLGWIIWGY